MKVHRASVHTDKIRHLVIQILVRIRELIGDISERETKKQKLKDFNTNVEKLAISLYEDYNISVESIHATIGTKLDLD